MKKVILLIVGIFLLSFIAPKQANVLIIGDSISIGYFPYVKKVLGDRANVIHNPGNAGNTGLGLEKLNEWLGTTKWDIIHFNWGLHDLCYRSPQSKVQGNRDKINGKITYTPEEYGKNLEELVVRLKKTGARLIFATTTYVPEGEAGRFAKDVKIYNEVALKIMKRHNILVNDLGEGSQVIHEKYGLPDGNVHYTAKGSELLAEPVVKYITKNLQ
jgi:hypothetical protein